MATAQILTFGVPITGIIHVGANRGQELEEYARETPAALLIEAIPRLCRDLEAKVAGSGTGFEVIEACCSDRSGEEITFNVASGGGDSSSMFEMGRLSDLYPTLEYTEALHLTTTTLDDLMAARSDEGRYNVLVIDTQGADLKVLQGATRILNGAIDFVYIEVSIEPIYTGGCTLDEIVSFLRPLGFSMRHLNVNVQDWGNALFSRDHLRFEQRAAGNLALGKTATQSSTHGTDRDFGPGNALEADFRTMVSSRTKRQNGAWWQVDLGAVRHVEEVYWLDRRRRATAPVPTHLLVSDDGESWTRVASFETDTPRKSNRLILGARIDRKTRFLRLQVEGLNSVSVFRFYAF